MVSYPGVNPGSIYFMSKRNRRFRDGSTRAADLRRAALINFMRARDLTPASWADAAGVNRNSIYNFLNGLSESLNVVTMEKLAHAENVQVSELMGESPVRIKGKSQPIRILGEVQAGQWREAIEQNDASDYPVIMPPIPGLGGDHYALMVRGTSMNKVYPDGTPVICSPLFAFRRQLQPGDKVHVERRNRHGQIEATIKEIDQDPSGKLWLWPRSTDPQHQTAIPLPTGDGDAPAPEGVEHIEIKGVVVFAILKQA